MMKITDCQLEKTSFVDSDLIQNDIAKIIFIGRSNVGKSSLINKLAERKKLARISSTPGKTISINYYRVKIMEKREEKKIQNTCYFVDLPGYGYAKIPKKESQRVKQLLSTFFLTIKNARLAVLLIDSRRDFMDSDLEVISQILDKKINILTVLTKSDKLTYSELTNRKKTLKNKYDLDVVAFTIKSSKSREELLELINKALME